ncbi:hypothetical protein HMPREF9123_0347 [Neisseria bacilliformis ATCC BAA-1200]|uniref:Uncharacterized protein n=1 Tax=Neisseria bacilliformis ATCC BAA-1200 TaxID=888742 RepID=F2B9J1_9NEIS|nr:hypothetical protein HMPREF9123_0347 [Neisseria bacilliformis ATCC BAA-1200]
MRPCRPNRPATQETTPCPDIGGRLKTRFRRSQNLQTAFARIGTVFSDGLLSPCPAKCPLYRQKPSENTVSAQPKTDSVLFRRPAVFSP